ncbi:hypothetical protein GGR50DRAFT_640693 [Xylaria sp. CBS 124048]|nr:hypothetical protein GGR50DRAFT_640693 [Xylaria sp. CBS 124048]
MTSADSKFLATMFKYLPTSVQIEWDDFAKDMNLKNGLVAKTRCRQIRSKLNLLPGAEKADGTASTGPTTLGNTKVTKQRTPRKSRKKAKELSEVAIKKSDSDEEDEKKPEVGEV